MLIRLPDELAVVVEATELSSLKLHVEMGDDDEVIAEADEVLQGDAGDRWLRCCCC